MLHSGEASGMGLADRVCLPYGVIEPLLEKLRMESLVEVKSALGTGSAGYSYALRMPAVPARSGISTRAATSGPLRVHSTSTRRT